MKLSRRDLVGVALGTLAAAGRAHAQPAYNPRPPSDFVVARDLFATIEADPKTPKELRSLAQRAVATPIPENIAMVALAQVYGADTVNKMYESIDRTSPLPGWYDELVVLWHQKAVVAFQTDALTREIERRRRDLTQRLRAFVGDTRP